MLVTRYVIPRLIEMASKPGDGVIVMTGRRPDELNGVGWGGVTGGRLTNASRLGKIETDN